MHFYYVKTKEKLSWLLDTAVTLSTKNFREPNLEPSIDLCLVLRRDLFNTFKYDFMFTKRSNAYAGMFL